MKSSRQKGLQSTHTSSQMKKLVSATVASTIAVTLLSGTTSPAIPLVPTAYAAEAGEAASTIAATVGKPIPSVAPGRYEQTVSITLSSETAGATMYYTLDGMQPDETSTRYDGSPIVIRDSANLSVIAEKDGVWSEPMSYGYIVKSQEKPLLQFVEMSDVHIGPGTAEEDAKVRDRYKRNFDVISSIFSNPDAIILNGDNINDNWNGLGPHHAFVKDVFQEQLARKGWTDTTKIQFAMGNHDATVAEAAQYYPENWFTADPNGYYEKTIGNYSFLYLNSEKYDTTQSNWLKGRLAALTSDSENRNKPIFVVLHRPITGTVMDDQQTSNPAIYNDLKNFPQVITFSGHSHLDINDERSIYQKDFTSVNDGSMSYIEVEHGYSAITAEGLADNRFTFPQSQGLFVEVYADRVEIERIAFDADAASTYVNGVWQGGNSSRSNSAGSLAGKRWVIKLEGNTNEEIKNNFKYTDATRNKNAPSFPTDADIAVAEGANGKPELTFTQAMDDQFTHHYNIKVMNARTGDTLQTYSVLSEFYVSPTPRQLTMPLDGLANATAYVITVAGVDAYGNTSSKLQTTYQTEGEAQELTPIDPATMWNGLVTDMKFDSNIVDQAEGGANSAAQVGNVTYVEGKNGKAISIPAGSGNYVDLGNRTDLKFGSGSFTVSFWHLGNLSHDQTIISNKDWASGGNKGWYIGPATGNAMVLNMGTGSSRIDSGVQNVGNEWHHFTITVDREHQLTKTYIDGVERQSTSLAPIGTASMDTNYNIILGADGRKNYANSNVTLDDLKIWNRSLTSTEAKALSDAYKMESSFYTYEQLATQINETVTFLNYVNNTLGLSVPVQQEEQLQAALKAAQRLTPEDAATAVDQAYLNMMWALRNAQESVVYNFVPKQNFSIDSFSSFADNESAYASNILDGSTSTLWISRWLDPVPDFPHWVIIDMKDTYRLSGIQRTSRPRQTALEFPKDFTFYASDHLEDLNDPAYLANVDNQVTGMFGKTWTGTVYKDYTVFSKPVQGRYVKFMVNSSYGTAGTFTSMSEIDFTGERLSSEYALLTDLQINHEQVYDFASDTTKYTVQVANEITSADISYQTADADAVVTVTGADKLKVGLNYITVKVEAHGASQTYTIEVQREATADHALFLPFDGNALTDYSPNQLTSKVQGNPGYVPGRVGQGIELKTTGAADRQTINLGTQNALQFGTDTDFTISFWIKSNPVSGDPAIFSNKNWNNGSNVGYLLALAGSSLRWNYNTQGEKRVDADVQGVADGAWHHVTVAHDRHAGTVSFYKDGSLVKEVSIGKRTGTIDSGLNTMIGNDGTGMYSQANQVQLDEVQIWRKALSAAEVAADYNSIPPVPLTEKFVGSLNLIGAQQAVKDAQIRFNLDLRTPTMSSPISKMKVTLAYDNTKLRFVSSTKTAKVDIETPGIVTLEINGSGIYNQSNPLEFAQSRISELRFDTIGDAGQANISVSAAEFYSGNSKYELETLNKGTANVQINDKLSEDLNQDGFVTIGDLALGEAQGRDDQMLQEIANKSEFKPYKHVVVIGIDGGGAAIRKEAPYWETAQSQKEEVGDRLSIPNIRSIVEGGAVSYSAQTTLPSSSSPNWGSMLNGVGYEKHDLYNDETEKYTYSETWEYPTVFKKLREYLPTNKLAAFATWGNIIQGHYEPSVGVEAYQGANDNGTVQAFQRYVEAGKAHDTALMFMQLDELDGAGHSYGFYTKSYYEKLKVVDQQVGQVYNTLRDHDMLDDTLVIILPDHGGGVENANGTLGSPGSHGQDSALAKTIFFAANGRTVMNDNGKEKILNGGNTRDVAATILTALGEHAVIGDSHAIDGMFSPQADLNKEGNANLLFTKVADSHTGAARSYEVFVSGLEHEAKALDLLVNTEGAAVQTVEPAQAGVEVIRHESVDGVTRIIVSSSQAITLDKPIVKLNMADGGEGDNVGDSGDGSNVGNGGEGGNDGIGSNDGNDGNDGNGSNGSNGSDMDASIISAMIADASGRETLPNLTKSERTEAYEAVKLAQLFINDIAVDPFSPDVFNYTVHVANGVTAAAIRTVVDDESAAVIVLGGQDLQVGDNEVTVQVTSQHGRTVIYTVHVIRDEAAPIAEEGLLDLQINGNIIPGFLPEQLEYTLTVPYATTVTSVTYAAADPLAVVNVVGGEALQVGANEVTITVTSQQGAAKVYRVNIIRLEEDQLPAEAALRDLRVDGATIAGFSAEQTAYTVTVPYAKSVVAVTYEAVDPLASVTVIGGEGLQVGTNSFVIEVKAQDGTSRTYSLTIIREEEQEVVKPEDGTGNGTGNGTDNGSENSTENGSGSSSGPSSSSSSSATGTDATPVTPAKPALPDAAVGIAEQVISGSSHQIKVTFPQGKTELYLLLAQLNQLKGRTLELVTADATLFIPADLLHAASSQTKTTDLSAAISVKAEALNQALLNEPLQAANQQQHTTYTVGGGSLSLQLSSTPANSAKQTPLALAKPVKAKFAISPAANRDLVGVYQLQADGTIVFVGGKLVDGGTVLEVELPSIGEYAVLAKETNYEDIPAAHWAHHTIQKLSAQWIVNGQTDRLFAPNQQVTRAEFAALLTRALQLDAAEPVPFSDVVQGDWYASAVAAAFKAGIIQGITQDQFAPNQTMKREEMALMLVRAYEFMAGETITVNEPNNYADADRISAWAAQQVQAAASIQLLQGYGNGTFGPAMTAGRAEAAQAILNMLERLADKAK